MPNSKAKTNQSDDDKDDKKKLNELGDLNVTHQKEQLKNQIDTLSQKVQAIIEPVSSSYAQSDREKLTELDAEFSKLIEDTNTLKERVKKLQAMKLPSNKQRWKVAKEIILYLHGKKYEKLFFGRNDKKLFFVLETALDNVSIIDAYFHEATLFKVGLLYKAFLNHIFKPEVIDLSIVIRMCDLPDDFKYIEEEGKLRPALWIELAKQAYDKIVHGSDGYLQQRFSESYKNLKKVYLGLNEPEVIDDIPDNEIMLPEIPNFLPENNNNANEIALSKSSTRYVEFTGSEFIILQLLIPEHKKNNVFIPEIGGVVLDIFMQGCLSKQISVKETKDSELRKRTASDQFILKLGDIVNDAQRAMHSDKTGQIISSDAGYVSWLADPDIIYPKVTELHKGYEQKKTITQECNLSGSELVKNFFEKVFKVLNNIFEKERLKLSKSYNDPKNKPAFFDKRKSKKAHDENLELINKDFQQALNQMRNFEKIMQYVDSEHIKLFAAPASGHAVYSVPKEQLSDAVLGLIAAQSTSCIVKTLSLGRP